MILQSVVKMRSMRHATGDEKETTIKGLFRNFKFPTTRHPVKSVEFVRYYLRPRDIPPEEASRILDRLNSLSAAEQLENVVNKHAKKKILSTGDAQRILCEKAQLVEFQDLQQVMCVRIIGAEKFDAIVRALSNRALPSNRRE